MFLENVVKRIHTYLITFFSIESFIAATLTIGVAGFTFPSVWVAFTFCKINSPYHFVTLTYGPTICLFFKQPSSVCASRGFMLSQLSCRTRSHGKKSMNFIRSNFFSNEPLSS